MNDLSKRLAHLSPAKRALLALEMGEQPDTRTTSEAEPIAIVGLGCRFPGGVESAEDFWRLLRSGTDAIVEVPASRWDIDLLYDPNPDVPGKMNTRWGGFLKDVETFDARFFGISPREAARMDPQQRLLLEVSWEALEAAGQAPPRLVGSDAGVFVGISTNDYSLLQVKYGDVQHIDAYVGTGNSASVASGRLSYILGLQGPCLSVDTACSSSLVAVHLACQSLRGGECRMALAGGVNVMLSPEITINFSKARMMAADGRCKTFDAAADGYVRGEGCGMVVLKRYADAVADGDDVLAVIAGSAVNQDGRSGGLTVPNGPAQESVIRRALSNAGVDPADVSYVEAHGTGTSLGDPIEIGALGAVFGPSRRERVRLEVGSVKTNLGHLEAAAGVAGLIKVVLALRHQEIPPHLHLREVNPHIAAMGLPIAIPTRAIPWSSGGRRVAGVSAFGFSGTNAHVVVAESPARKMAAAKVERPAHILCLSAKTADALAETVARMRTHLAQHADASIADVCFTANAGRAHFDHRVAVVAESSDEMQARLAQALAPGKTATASEAAPQNGRRRKGKVAFLFTGQGSQYAGMGRRLFETQPTFRRAFERCDAVLQPRLGTSLLTLMDPGTDCTSMLQRTSVVQPALFALEYALSELWRSWGIEPGAVMGHSVGEYVAACVGGVFDLEDALGLIAERGRLMESSHRDGGMAMILADEAVVAQALEKRRHEVAIAALNGPRNVVISGRSAAVRAILDELRQAGIGGQLLEVSHAFHSPLLDGVLDPFEAVAAKVRCRAPHLALISNLTGRAFGRDQVPDGRYWRRHLREPVRFADGVRELQSIGCDVFIEIGPQPTLVNLAKRCVARDAATWLPSLLAGKDDWHVLLESLGTLYRSGMEPDWAAFDRDYPRRRVALPTYPWQRERCWSDDLMAGGARGVGAYAEPVPVHPLLGRRIEVADDSVGDIWQVVVPASSVSGPSPAAALQLASAAAAERFGAAAWTLEEVEFRRAIEPAAAGESSQSTTIQPTSVQLILGPVAAGEASFRIFRRPGGAPEQEWSWSLAALGRVRSALPHIRNALKGQRPRTGMGFGLMFFASGEDAQAGDKYRLVIDSARYADAHGFESVWVPERHFGQWGSLYPNPSVLHAALARETRRVRLRAGSVVLPLHQPLRIAEEWSVVDNLSGGRVDLSFASGWNPADFALAPERYANRHEDVFAGIETVKKLWRGESIAVRSGDGSQIQVRTYPTPVQREVGVWVTAAGNPRTFERAGEIGANVLTHLLDQGVEAVAEKIRLYRQARERAGFDPAAGHVSIMLHTFVGADVDQVREQVRQPFCDYLKTLKPLLKSLAQSRGRSIDIDALSGADLDAFVNFLYERFFSTRALLGTPESCRALIEQLAGAGVNEVACLLDFGPGTQQILDHLPHLNRLRELCESVGAAPPAPAQAQAAVLVSEAVDSDLNRIRARCGQHLTGEQLYASLERHGVHYQGGFRGVQQLWVGAGEALGSIAVPAEHSNGHNGNNGNKGAAGALQLHPGLLDACFQVFVAAALNGTDASPESFYLPKGVERFQLLGKAEGPLWSHARLERREDKHEAHVLRGEIKILDASGNLVAQASGFRLERAAPATAARARPEGLDQWLYELRWEPTALTPAQGSLGRWLVLADRGSNSNHISVGEQLAVLLRAAGAGCECVYAGDLNSADQSDEPLRARVREWLSQTQGTAGSLVHLWALDSVPLAQSNSADVQAEQRLGADAMLTLIQTLASEAAGTPLWVITRAAQAVRGETELSLSQSPLWGLGRTCAMEHAEVWGGLIDLDPQVAAGAAAAQLLEVLRGANGEDQNALRAGQRYVARLIQVQDSASSKPPPLTIHADASYLITGGLWGLGFEVARWLAHKGARELLLIGRSALPPKERWGELEPHSRAARQVAGILELEQLGVSVRYAQLDVADEASLSAWWQRQQSDGVAPVRGVIHAASVWQDQAGRTLVRPLLGLDRAAMHEVFAPKVNGSFALERVLGQGALDFFVCFSSGASLVGSVAQGNYAAASAFLDALAQHRRLQGRPGLSLNWGAVSQAGFGATLEGKRVHEYWEGHGIGRIDPGHVLEALERFIPQTRAQIGVMRNDWGLLARSYPRLASLPLARYLVAPGNGQSRLTGGGDSALLEEIASVSADQRRVVVAERLREHVAAALRMDAAEVDVEQPLANLGFDSLMAIEIKTRVETDFGVVLPPTRLLESPTIASLTEGTLALLPGLRTQSAAAIAASGQRWQEGEL